MADSVPPPGSRSTPVKPWGIEGPTGINEWIKNIVSLAFLALGVALYTLHYSQKISSSAYRLQPLTSHPLLTGALSFTLGGGFYLRKLWKSDATIEKQVSDNETKVRQRFEEFKLVHGFNSGSPVWNGYQISTKVFNQGNNKDIYLAYSEEKGYAIVSVLSEMQVGKKQFDKMKVPEAVIREYQKCSANQPGLGKILAMKVEGEPGKRKQWTLQSYYPNGNLYSQLGKLTKEQRLQFAFIIAQSLLSLHSHSKELVQRDINPHNIVLDDNNLPVLLDLDLLCFGDLTEVEEDAKQGYQSKRSSLGAPLHWSPEMFQSDFNAEDYNRQKADVWAFGWILYFLFVDPKPALANAKKIEQAIDQCGEKCEIAQNFREKFISEETVDEIGDVFLEKFDLNRVKLFDHSFEPLRDILKKFLTPDPILRCTVAHSGLIEALEKLQPMAPSA